MVSIARAVESLRRLLDFPFIGVSHSERAFIAVTLFARCGGKVDDALKARIRSNLMPFIWNRRNLCDACRWGQPALLLLSPSTLSAELARRRIAKPAFAQMGQSRNRG